MCPTTTTTTSSTTTTTSTISTTLPGGSAIVAPTNTWTWVDFPDSACDDGSATGIGLNPSAMSDHVLVFLNGGGGCWDYLTCFVLNTAVHGPFGQAQFAAFVQYLTGTVFDRTMSANPFKDWSFVIVPYCTGDFHAGTNVATYTSLDGQTTRMFYHVGHANVLAYLARLAPTFPGADRVVIAGSSAGGLGAALNYPDVRGRWPAATVEMVDDSGPFLEPSSAPLVSYAPAFASWRLDRVTDPVCGAPCRTDMSLFFSGLASTYPGSRLALISSLQDETISSGSGLSGPAFQSALVTMAADRLDPTARFHYFFFPGSTHTTLFTPANFSENETTLLTWLTQLVTDDPAWTSRHP